MLSSLYSLSDRREVYTAYTSQRAVTSHSTAVLGSVLLSAMLLAPSTSRAADACPCFNAAEIAKVCPRPDAGHTESYVYSGKDRKSRKIKCYASRNYSPGSIEFEVSVPNDGRAPACGKQSIEVTSYPDGGEWPDVTPAQLAACTGILDEAAGKLGLKLVKKKDW